MTHNTDFVVIDGKTIHKPSTLLLSRGMRYGDGFFETMRWHKQSILHWHLHWQRIQDTCQALFLPWPLHLKETDILNDIHSLCSKKKIAAHARVRINFFRGVGGIFEDNSLHYLIEVWPFTNTYTWNENGLDTDVFLHTWKNYSPLAKYKTNNALVYALGGIWSKKNKLNDAIIINDKQAIVETAIGNIFFVRHDDQIVTPAISEGCIDGIMRNVIMNHAAQLGYHIVETTVKVDELDIYKEVFMTNAIKGVQWIKAIGKKTYTQHTIAHQFYKWILEA